MHERPNATMCIPVCLMDGGATGLALREHDWAKSPLGDPATWPASLATLVGVMLGAHQPTFILWGPERRLLYNDAYARLLGAAHPAALGRDYREVRHAVAADLEPLLAEAWAGRAVHADGPRGPWVSLSCVPVRNAAGGVDGLYGTCTEGAGHALGESRRRETEERQSFLLALSDALRPLSTPAEIVEVASHRLGARVGASRVFYAEIAGSLMTVEREYIDGVGTIVGRHSLAAFGPDLLTAYRDGGVVAVEDVPSDPRFNPEARAGLGAREVGAFVDVVLFRGRNGSACWRCRARSRAPGPRRRGR